MSPARRLALNLSRMLFRFMLVTLISLVALFITFGNSSRIKQALVDVHAYQRFIPAVMDANAPANAKDPSIFTDKEVRKIAEASFTPQKLQQESERFINAWYGWLNGSTYQPEFVVDFTTARNDFATKLSDYEISRLASLPQCSTMIDETTVDPFKATCRPVGMNFAAERVNLRQSLLTSEDFLPKVTYTLADMPKTKDGRTIPEAFAYAPFLFGMLWYITWALAILVLLLGVTTVLLRPVRRNGWHQLGRTLFSTGIFLTVSGYIFGLVIPRSTASLQSQFTTNGTEQIFSDISAHLTARFEYAFIIFSALVAAVGLAILAILKLIKPASRYDGLERVTGLVNGLRPKVRYAKASKANGAPIISSERRNSTRYKRAKKQTKKSRAAKELA